MNYHNFTLVMFLTKRFALILFVAAVIAGITYWCYDSFHSTTDEVNKIENYHTLAKDEVRYVLATANPTVQQMIADYPDDYTQFTTQMDSLLMMYQIYQPRHKKALVTLSKTQDTQLRQLSKSLLRTYRKTKIDLTPFEEEGVESINEFDRLNIKMTTLGNYQYKSSSVVYRFMETNSGVHFKLTLGFLCTCEADSVDLARYTADLAR